MASIGVSSIKLIDSDGDALDDGAGKLNVNATLVDGATIDIGDVDMFLDGGTAILGGAGVVASGVLRVTLASDDPGVALLGTIDSDTNAIKTAVEILDNAIDGNEMQVDIVSSATITVDGTVTANLSSTDNTVLDNILTKNTEIDTALDTIKVDTEAIETAVEASEVLLGTIDSDTDAIKTAVEGTITVDGTVTANLGSTDNAVLDAIAASLEILDDWDDSNYANVNINLAGSDAPTGGGAESGALRVTLANDSTGVISIDDGGNTITVDGTVAVTHAALTELGTAINASDQVDVNIASGGFNGAVTGTFWQATQPTSVASGQVASGAIASGAIASGAIASGAIVDIPPSDGHGTVSHVARNVTDSAVQLASLACKHVDIMATIANTGIVYMGASGVSATTGIALYPGDVYSVDITNTNLLYAISTVSGDDINMVVYT